MTSLRSWLEQEAQARVERAVAELEQKCAAEVVVTVRRSSGDYRAADLTFASAMCFVALVVYVYFPVVFADDPMPPALLALFLVSVFLSSQFWPLRRLLLRRATLRRNVRRAALTEFHDQRITRTRGRTGILIYASLFERELEVVFDVGLDLATLGDGGARAVATIRGALRSGGLEELVRGLSALGDALAPVRPHAADDVNELPDAVVS
ncbi:MAG: hypothetical protein OZ921_17985 [Sorangiineae bacterium]|nr:hypothetical protein [Polyangiaceae bacterium]MEB2324409.1 hypothetical protein [Sorangiineae bacterium]